MFLNICSETLSLEECRVRDLVKPMLRRTGLNDRKKQNNG
jgi:hypothetical protein